MKTRKKLLSLAVVIITTCTNALGAITPTSTQMWWGYFSETHGKSLSLYSSGIGYGQASTIDVAIFIPAGQEMVSSSTVKAVRFWLGKDISSMTGDVKIWISKTQPSNISQADYVQKVPVSSLVIGANDVELTTPFTVNNAGFYVGYTYTANDRAYPIMCGGDDTENSFFYRNSSGEWNNFYGEGYGMLALQILLDGGDYPTNRAEAIDFGQTIVLSGVDSKVPVAIRNTGANAIESISYTITTDGTVSEEKELKVSSLSYNSMQKVNISFDAETENRRINKVLTITKVNGIDNTAKQNKATGSLLVIAEKPEVTPVVEEFTGTWCGYCPYGLVGMQKAHEQFGDKVALIAIHSGDIMDISAYGPVINTFASGFPSSRINRDGGNIYPSSSTLISGINKAFNRMTQGSIELTATWKDDNKTSIDFATKTKFAYNDSNGDYGIAFVLVEDGLTGTGSDWAQANYLSGGGSGGEMEFWYNSGSRVTGIVFDHIAVAAWDILNGVSESVKKEFKAGEVLPFSFSGDITSFKDGNQQKSSIQDKSKLTAIALLIDKTNGKIVNACQSRITDGKELLGDVNGDGKVNVADIVAIIKIIAAGGYDEKADVNHDNKVSEEDVLVVTKIIFN